MIPSTTNAVTTQGDLGGERHDFSIHASNLAHIMEVLSGLYSDTEAAAIREYSTNALDAHVEAGNTAPIEVTTPTVWNPFFRVQDFGVGLSVDDLTKVYASYGASTKRGTNDQVGSFGLGGKSALTYTNTFTITAVKNGVKTLGVISRKADGIPELEIVDTSSTTEPNGVLIEIPVQDRNSFLEKSLNFFKFWKPGTVLVNGEQPPHHDAIALSDDVYWFKGATQSYVVMGNVAYPVKQTDDYFSARRTQRFIAHIPIGSVDLTPSREELKYTDKTEALVAQVRKDFEALLEKTANDEAASAKTPAEALKVYMKWNTIVSNIMYNGKPIPTSVPTAFIEYRPGAYRHQVNSTSQFRPVDMAHVITIKGFKAKSVATNYKQRIKNWLLAEKHAQNHGFNGITVHLVDEMPKSEWYEPKAVVDWADIPLLPKQTSGSAGARKMVLGSWERYANTGTGVVEVTTLDTTKPIVYVSGSENINSRWNSHRDALRLMSDDVQFLRLGMNRWEKFKREFPQAMHIREYVQSLLDAVATSADERKYYQIPENWRNFMGHLSRQSLDDPVLAEWARVGGVVLKDYSSLKTLCVYYGVDCSKLSFDSTGSTFREDVFKKYPLLSAISPHYTSHAKDLAVYLNAAYALTQP